MAQAYPHFGAGEGDMIGIHGTSSEWPYIVEVDNEGDDPLTVLFTVAALGAPHPDPRFTGVVVSDYRKDKQLNERWWRIFVLFSPLSDEVIGQWRRSVQFANETRRIEKSLANLRVNADGSITVLDESLPIGPSKWDVAELTAASHFHTLAAPRNAGDRPDIEKRLLRTMAIDADRAGMEINDGIAAISYENLIQQVSILRIMNLHSHRWHTNRFDWPRKNLYPRWSLIFSNYAIDDRVLNLPIAGPYWFSHVILEFLYRPLDPLLNPFGWRGLRAPEYYRDDQGFRSLVFERRSDGSDVEVTKDYVTYNETNFADIFRAIGASTPVI